MNSGKGFVHLRLLAVEMQLAQARSSAQCGYRVLMLYYCVADQCRRKQLLSHQVQP